MKCILCLFVLLTSVTFCQASPINFGSLVGQTVSLTVEPYASGENNGAYFVGLTAGYINNDPPQSVWIFCRVVFNQVKIPATYEVTVVSLVIDAFTGNSLGMILAQVQQQA